MRDYSDMRGTRNPMAKHGDDVVQRARVMRRKRIGYATIGKALGGIHKSTIRQWVNYTTRDA